MVGPWSGPSIEPSSRLISEERLTQIGAIVGTPGYMSPEQLRSAETDARSDQFSFCAALYEALYQRLPFGGETLETYAEEVLAWRLLPPPPSEVPIAVEKAVLRGLETAPERRFPSMAELIQVLESGSTPTRSPRHAARQPPLQGAAGDRDRLDCGRRLAQRLRSRHRQHGACRDDDRRTLRELGHRPAAPASHPCCAA